MSHRPNDDDLARDLAALFDAEASTPVDVHPLVERGLQRGVRKRRTRRLALAAAALAVAGVTPAILQGLGPSEPTIAVRPPHVSSGPATPADPSPTTSSPSAPTETERAAQAGVFTSPKDGDKVATCQFYRGTTNVEDPEGLVLVSVNLDRPGRIEAEFMETAAPKWLAQQRMQVSGDRIQVTLWALAPGGRARIDQAATKPHNDYRQLVYKEAIKGKRLDRIVVTSKGGGIDACKGGPPG
jgi:hypothetical protein